MKITLLPGREGQKGDSNAPRIPLNANQSSQEGILTQNITVSSDGSMAVEQLLPQSEVLSLPSR